MFELEIPIRTSKFIDQLERSNSFPKLVKQSINGMPISYRQPDANQVIVHYDTELESYMTTDQ
jgi:hypothetical protein